jgi:hypothetical protein
MSRAGLANGAPYLLSLRLLRWPAARRQTLLLRIQMNFDGRVRFDIADLAPRDLAERDLAERDLAERGLAERGLPAGCC